MENLTLFGKPDKNIRELLKQYFDYQRTECNASPHTLVNYEIDLRHWLKFLMVHHGTQDLFEQLSNLKTLRSFLSSQSKRCSRATICRRLSAIKGFLKFLHREGYLEKNIAKCLAQPKLPQKLPLVLKPEEMIRLIEDLPNGTLPGKRTRAILELLYSTGIRLSELVGLNQEHADLRKGQILVLGKGRKERVVPMGRHCQKAISDYIGAMPAAHQRGAKTPLFLNRDGERLSGRTIQRYLKRFATEILGERGLTVSPHTFRHSCATHLLGAGAGLREIQEFLGHRSLTTTQKYTQVDRRRLKAAYERAHPRERTRREKEQEEVSNG
ncbi:MAG: tyrosine recombinase XerC [Deltaproteobacteria bacterium]|nr:tyrosine recombinase XerC [Deltaproteobacteria bacterium]